MSEVIQFPNPKRALASSAASGVVSAGRPEREASANPFDTPIVRAIDHLLAMQDARLERGK